MTIDCNEVLIFPVLLYIIFSFYLEIVAGKTMFHSFVSELCFRGYIRCSAIRPCREYAVESVVNLNTHCLLLSGLRAHLVEQQRSVSFLNLNTLFFLTLLILFFLFSLGIIYSVFTVANWFAPSFIGIFGPRVSMIVGGICYA